MDITNITPYAPPDGAQITLPYTFTWGVRANLLENYRLIIVPVSGSGGFAGPYDDHTGAYTLAELTSGLHCGVEYRWYLWIDGGHEPLVSAYSLSDRRVTFVNVAATGATHAIVDRLVPRPLSRRPIRP